MSKAKQAASAAETEKVGAGYYIKLMVSLLLITAITSLLLALVNGITAPTIERIAEEKRQAAMSVVMPDAVYTQMEYTNEDVDNITAAYKGSDLIGYCVEVSPNGFGGAIKLMVGVDVTGAVTGVSILKSSETAGLGSKAGDPNFLNQYVGKSGTINVKTGDNAIDAVSGATVTSKAVTSGVNRALAAIVGLSGEGGVQNGEGKV